MQMHEEEAPDTLEAGGPTQAVAVGQRDHHLLAVCEIVCLHSLVGRDPGAAGVADSSGCALAAPASSRRSPRRTTKQALYVPHRPACKCDLGRPLRLDSTFRPASGAGLGSLLRH